VRIVTDRIRTLEAAAAFVDRAGLALVFPKEGLTLPSLYTEVAGPNPTPWEEQRDDGKMEMSPEFRLVWGWKSELAERRLACVGKHVGGQLALVSLAVLPALYALTGRSGAPEDFRDAVLPPLEREVAEAVLESAPADAPGVRRAIGVRDTGRVARAIDSLQKRLVLTRAGEIQRETGWAGTAYDLLARHHPLTALPSPEDARVELAARLLAAADTLSPALAARLLGITRTEAGAALEQARARVA
jgi:hypothetical protein